MQVSQNPVHQYPPPIFDSHAHLDDPRFDEDRREVLERARSAGIRLILNPAVDLATSRAAVALAERVEWIYAAVGIGPSEAARASTGDYEILAGLAKHPKVIAWGEIGLDYLYPNTDRQAQKDSLAGQIRLAGGSGLPMLFHFREAGDDFFSLLEAGGVGESGGVMHCFTGSQPDLDRALNLGLHISFAGMITFPKAQKQFRSLVRGVPDERLLVETDSPWIAPVPHRGRRCEPAMLADTVDHMAALRGQESSSLAALTYGNGIRLFGLPGNDGP